MTTPAAPALATLGELRASGHQYKEIKQELRDNLLTKLAGGEERFPGIVGFDETVLPELERALLAGHDVVLLGERGQGKTRLIRSLVHLLDEWTPAVAGCEVNDHPYAPICVSCRRRVAAEGDDLEIVWRHRSERYGEKLATPDTSVGDLIGDLETVHYGLVPRTNRGIFSVNELPDLAERIQVALLNVLEERDIQVRGYQLRLPLDLVLVASANPEDYTNRGRIITPLKDRFGAEIRTHYPLRLDDEISLVRQEAVLRWQGGALGEPVVPDHVIEIIARFTRAGREAPQIDARSGVSARFAIAAAETAAASAVRRAAVTGEAVPVVRVVDLPATVPTALGKIEFDQFEEGRELDLLKHLLRRAVAETYRSRLAGADLSGLLRRFDDGRTVETGELVPAPELLRRIGQVPGLADLMRRVRQRRRDLTRQGDLGGTLDRIRELLDAALEAERGALAGDSSDEARLAETELDQLADHQWRSPEAELLYEQIRDLLRRELLDTRFRGMRDALAGAGPHDLERVREMLAELNAMLDADARGEDTTAAFDQFMQRYGDLFPDNPRNLEELVDSLARRAAAASRLLASLTPEQRAELAELAAAAFGAAGLQAELDRLAQALQGRRPGLPWGQGVPLRGGQPLGLGDATTALEELADLESLEASLGQRYPGASLDDVDREALERALGRSAVDDLEALRALERQLAAQGWLNRDHGELRLTPKAVRRIGLAALQRIFRAVEARE